MPGRHLQAPLLEGLDKEMPALSPAAPVADARLGQYRAPLQRVAIAKMLHQLSQVGIHASWPGLGLVAWLPVRTNSLYCRIGTKPGSGGWGLPLPCIASAFAHAMVMPVVAAHVSKLLWSMLAF